MRNYKRRGMCVISLFVLGSVLSGCGKDKCSTSFTAMDTYMEITAYTSDESVLDEAKQEVLRLECLLSVTDEGSETYAINHADGKSVEVSDETYEILSLALELAEETDGALDPTIYPLVEAWGFTTGDYRVPGEDEKQTLLGLVDYTKVKMSVGSSSEANLGENNLGKDDLGVDNSNEIDLSESDLDESVFSVTLPIGMELDLGAIAKGYAADAVCALLENAGVESALLYLGGNIQTIGTKPDGSAWRIGIQAPESSEYIGILSVSDAAVVTSGGYERYFTGDDGKTYWHIIDPATGYPADSGLLSVTIIADSGAYADALSTALFVMGAEEAIAFWQEHSDFDMVLLTESGEVYVTDGVYEEFELKDEEYRVVRVE